MVVDDMIANEAAFVAMRSGAVTKEKFRSKEVKERAKKYLAFFYPGLMFAPGVFKSSRFVLSDKKSVEKSFKKTDDCNISDRIVEGNGGSEAITIWKGKKKFRDYSGKSISKNTVKIYYFTRTTLKNKRYQASRNRMIPSPDEKYYYKALPTRKCFKK
jgi:hypothetical protein